MNEKFAKYATIEDILKGGYGKENVRVLGFLQKIEPQNRVIILNSSNFLIECEIPEKYLQYVKIGSILQVYGSVVLGTMKPRILAKIVRNMNGVDEEAYEFAVKAYNKYLIK
jgi:hypothetical protein